MHWIVDPGYARSNRVGYTKLVEALNIGQCASSYVTLIHEAEHALRQPIYKRDS